MVDDGYEQYQIPSTPTILNGQIAYDSKGEIILSVYHEKKKTHLHSTKGIFCESIMQEY
jgi:hypothetical protein